MISLSHLQQLKARNEPFGCLTCYDATFAKAMEVAEIETILIGDSLGMVVQGNSSTLPVTIDDMVYHTQAVAKGNQHALLLADMPFMSYATLEEALSNARVLMQAGAHVVKLEGGAWLAETVRQLARGGIPSCIHLGLTPQSVNVLGGYRVQGKTREAADQLLADCEAVVAAGAALLLLECVPSQLAAEVQARFPVPVIGIGAGPDCDGQVLVMHDMLGLTFGKPARFVRNFMSDSESIVEAFTTFQQAVKRKDYPAPEHCFQIAL